jgi:ComF family protein
MVWPVHISDTVPAVIRGTVRRAVDIVLPPRCLGCGALVGEPGAVCPSCWSGIDFITAPMCHCCGLPFDYDEGPGAICGDCARRPPLYGHARSAMIYNDASRRLVLAFKHSDRTDAAPAWGHWLSRAGSDLLAAADILVPVPLHRRRLITRRYNQAALMAQALGQQSGLPVAVDALRRTRATPSQGRMNRSQRERNVAGAFAVRDGRLDDVRGARILLVDDVMTTGATLTACIRPLLRAGALNIDVLTLARVSRTG